MLCLESDSLVTLMLHNTGVKLSDLVEGVEECSQVRIELIVERKDLDNENFFIDEYHAASLIQVLPFLSSTTVVPP